ncbi:YihY/virulence factor BrkB family protein [Sphingomonas sp.]|uniref:YihY/virulence factor BrkB family protein n=1 Tax=Sphingomonas sp. TaxID=28214 RepID=UPI0025D23A59|nr:YihY/virulence factor BrkB family protein [Sphingomonas sp.]
MSDPSPTEMSPEAPPPEPASQAPDTSPQTPEARREQQQDGNSDAIGHKLENLGPFATTFEVGKRVVVGVFSDGFIHAGNLAYLTLLTLFPFFIVIAALASILGRSDDSIHAVNSFLLGMPSSVQTLLRKPIHDVLTQKTGWLLLIGGLVGLWTVGSFIETIRDILRRAYGSPFTAPFWQYRLTSIGIIIAAVILMMLAFSAQVVMTAAEQFIYHVVPFAGRFIGWIQLSRLVPLFVAFVALYLLFWSLTPSHYRFSKCPKWPGALFTATWWFGSLALLPLVLARLSNYDATYGSLAGVIIALIFFWFVGLGIVIGAHLNAALAEPPVSTLKDDQRRDLETQ